MLLKGSPEFNRLAFTVLAVEASAQKMGISPSEMRRRLDKVGLIKSLIQDCYDTLHISTDRALQIFYDSDVCRMLHDKELGLHLMSDTYIVNDLIEELRSKQ